MRRHLVIADAHVGQSDGDVDRMCGLVGLAADRGVGELIYLGDAFQYLLGLAKFWSPSVRRVLGAWDAARDAGVRITLIEGNRDFYLDEPDLAARVDRIERRYEIEAGGVRYRLVHGDKVNRRDLQYRFWARVSKAYPSRVLARLLPRRIAVAIVEHMEARLAETNRRFRYAKPVDDLRRDAERAWADGVDVVLWGHFHTPWEHSSDGRLALVVPAWLESGVSLAIEPDGTRSWLDTRLTPLERLPRMDP